MLNKLYITSGFRYVILGVAVVFIVVSWAISACCVKRTVGYRLVGSWLTICLVEHVSYQSVFAMDATRALVLSVHFNFFYGYGIGICGFLSFAILALSTRNVERLHDFAALVPTCTLVTAFLTEVIYERFVLHAYIS